MSNQIVRYIVLNTPFIEIDKREDFKISEIRKAIRDACSEYRTLWRSNTKLMDLLEFAIIDRYDINIDYITKNAYKENIRLLVSYNMPDESVADFQWVLKNSIHFIVKCIVDQEIELELWCRSCEGYSAVVKTNINNLEQIVLDILVDIAIEHKVLHSKTFKSLVRNGQLMNLLSSQKRLYVRDSLKKDIDAEEFGYCPFSSYFRESSGKYLINDIHQFWFNYLFHFTNKVEQIDCVHNVDDLLSLIQSKKNRGGLNRRQIINKFNQKCEQP